MTNTDNAKVISYEVCIDGKKVQLVTEYAWMEKSTTGYGKKWFTYTTDFVRY